MGKTDELIETLRTELKERPLEALRTYEALISKTGFRSKRLETIFGSSMKLVTFARSISGRKLIDDAPELFGSPRSEERRLLVTACVAQFIAHGADGAQEELRSIGEAFERLVLEGMQQQQLCGRIALELGQKSHAEVQPLLQAIAEPLIDALQVVLRVGAATTRDSAVEGLGALLKFFIDAREKFPSPSKIERREDHDEAQWQIDRLYFERLERRRLMVFAVARDATQRKQFFRFLKRPIASRIETIRGEARDAKDLYARLLDELYARADLLRTLPAIVRQSKPDERDTLQRDAIRYLRDAASFTAIREDDEAVLVAFAHYQESVFRTVDVMIKRRATHEDFDHVLAQALDATPRTLVGRSSVCNAQVRAAFALIRTAARLISDEASTSATKHALVPLFESIAHPPPWPNLGIAEGCYFVLPFLVGSSEHDNLSRPALDALFKRIKDPPPFEHLAETHHQLIASACFRRLILVLMQRTDERSATDPASRRVQRDVRRLLAEPTTNHVLEAFQQPRTWSAIMRTPAPQWTAGIVIAGTAFESDLLLKSVSLFEGFDVRRSVERLLLIRILAAQLRAASQDSREIARYALLRRFYANMPTVSLAEKERIEKARAVVAVLPPAAAQAADADLQDFLEHCGARSGEMARTARVTELPGHVLAMVSDKPSNRIADAIAREIDLSLRHGEKQPGGIDLGKLLYQIVLRGPNELVFDYLLPRIEKREDREMVALFRRHVASVRSDKEIDPHEMLKHVKSLERDITQTTSPILEKLCWILTRYKNLYANTVAIWESMEEDVEGGPLRVLFRAFDEIAKEAHVEKSKNVLRAPLFETFKDDATEIESQLMHYRDSPVSEFKVRAAALERAGAAASRIEQALAQHPGLQPPERVMLMSLMGRLQDFFTQTIRWFCDEPHHLKNARKEKRDPEAFFTLFASPDRAAACLIPAEFPTQRVRFEKFWVDWMAAELDVEVLKRQLTGRWSWPFRAGYRVMTSFFWISVVMLLPCILAIEYDIGERHDMEGVGFLLLELLILVAVLLSLLRWLRELPPRLWNGLKRLGATLRRWLRRKKAKSVQNDPQPSYRQEAILPRLARLVAVPMALIVEFEHSYTFPLHASTWVLLLLIILSFLTTWFFVDREIVVDREKRKKVEKAGLSERARIMHREIVVDREKRKKVEKAGLSERARIMQIVAVALTHSFVIAVLFAIIFASHADNIEPHPHDHGLSHGGPGILGTLETIAQHVDETRPPHNHPLFLGVLPRDVRFDTASFASGFGIDLPEGLAAHLQFTFYPTIVLTWTALGLFIGMFLEGFAKGERLRGETKPERESIA